MPWLQRLRVGTSLAGLMVVVAAISRDDRRLMWTAIALLAASVVVRLIIRREVSRIRKDVEGKEGQSTE